MGFCELNNWQELESYTDLYKNKVKMVYKAANAGFAYSHVMVNSQVCIGVYVLLCMVYVCGVCIAAYGVCIAL